MRDKLTADQYREALSLVLAELEALGLAPDTHEARVVYARRLGSLKASIRTIIGSSPHGTPPAYGLRGLRGLRDDPTNPDAILPGEVDAGTEDTMSRDRDQDDGLGGQERR